MPEMNRLTEQKCRELFELCHTPQRVIGHCEAVSSTGAIIAEALNRHGYNYDVELVRVAGLIHDVLRVEDNHAEKGYDLLISMGYPMEAHIVKEHMLHKFPALDEATELDMVCLADRLVTEDAYTGLDQRIDYLLHKPGFENQENRAKDLEWFRNHVQTFMDQIESVIGCTIDSLITSEIQG